MIGEYKKGKYDFDNCPLCKIHTCESGDCRGCPNAIRYGLMGCIYWLSYMAARDSTRGQLKRAKFWEKNLSLLESPPDKAFTKKGWRYDYFKDMEDVV